MKYKIIALFGKAGAGKDFIQQLVADNRKIHGIVSSTTRPPREYEREGVEYHFLTNDAFAQQVLDGTMLEATCFRDWFYGTSLNDIDHQKINIGVFNIQGIECLLQDLRLLVQPVYIKAPDKIRLIRQLEREDNPDCKEICRRFNTDYKDFLDIPFEYKTIINDNTISTQHIYDQIYDLCMSIYNI